MLIIRRPTLSYHRIITYKGNEYKTRNRMARFAPVASVAKFVDSFIWHQPPMNTSASEVNRPHRSSTVTREWFNCPWGITVVKPKRWLHQHLPGLAEGVGREACRSASQVRNVLGMRELGNGEPYDNQCHN